MQPVVPSSVDVDVTFRVLDSTTFLPYESLTSATSGLALWFRKGALGAVTAITEADHTNLTDAHSDGKLKHIDDGLYRLSLPDAAVPTAEHEVTTFGGTATGYVILGGALVGKPVEVVSGSLVAASVSGAVGSVTGAVGSVTGNVGGSVASVASGGITAGSIAADAIGSSELAADAVAEIAAAITAGATAAQVWAYATRTLTQGAASVTAAVSGSNVTVYRGTRWSISLTGLPSNTGYTAIIFSVKTSASDADADSIVYVRKNAPDVGSGLIYFDNAPTITAGQAAITVDSATAITITVEDATTQYATPNAYVYGIKYLDVSGNATQASIGGTFTVAPDLPMAVA